MVSQLPLKQFIGGSNPSACALTLNQHSGVATVVVASGSEPEARKFDSCLRAVAVLYWFRNLAVNQVYVGSIPIGHP